MYISQRKRVIAAAIATLLAAPAWATSVSANDPAKPRAGVQAESDASKKSDTERSSGTGTSQSGSAYGSGSATSSDAAGTGTTTGSAGTGTTTGSAGTGTTTGSAGTGTTTGSTGTGTSTSTSAGAATPGAGTGSTSQSMGSGPTTGDRARSTTGQTAAGQATTGTGSMGAGSRMAANPLYTRSADDLKGTDVVDSTGDKIGDIKEVVLSKDRRSAHAVIGVGGFLGIGEHDIAVSLDELKAHDKDELQLSATKEQLKERPQYQDEQYIELKGDQAISGLITDFAAFETDRNKTTGTGRDSTVGKAMDKVMDKDKDTRLPSSGTGTSTGTGASSGTATGSESKPATIK